MTIILTRAMSTRSHRNRSPLKPFPGVDIKNLATKDDISQLVTKSDILELYARLDRMEQALQVKDKQIADLTTKLRVQEEKHLSEQEEGTDMRERDMEEHFGRQMDELEQYGRRTSLRFNGIETNRAETNESLENKLIATIKNEFKVEVSADEINRLHRIGPKFKIKDSEKESQQVIVKLRSFKIRQRIYDARPRYDPDSQRRSNFRVQLDLTGRRYRLLKRARLVLKGNKNAYAYADMNCRLIVNDVGGYGKCVFNSDAELDELMAGIAVEANPDEEVAGLVVENTIDEDA